MILLAALLAAASPTDIVAGAPPSAWVAIPPENLLIVTSARGEVAIELAPGFAPAHVAAIKALVRAGRFDAGAVVRVQDNYVVQFAVPEGAAPRAPALAAEYDRAPAGRFTALGHRDVYAAKTGFSDGWPVARDGGREWLVHCYASVGVGRDLPPDTGDGSELYAVIGHGPRHLDRNIALVGRVVGGVDQWSSLPRGTGEIGFYRTPTERLPFTRVALASDLPATTRPRFEVMDTAGPAFAAYAEARANRRDAFFVRPAGTADICNVPVPVRRAP